MSEAIVWDTIINSKSQLKPFDPIKYVESKLRPAQKPKFSRKTPKKEEKKPEPGIIRLKNSKPKYQITDISGFMSDRQNVTLEVGWNVQPWVGALTWTLNEGQGFGKWLGVKGGRSEHFNLPGLKGKKTASETVVGSGETPKAAQASGVV